MGKKLRFAPLIRVSTETQEQQGESLNTQKSQIIDAVKSLNGEIPSYCWIYSGQEHATPEFERNKFNQLLEDSDQDLFDAVIVFDPSRWSRDNLNSKKGLEILKSNGIKFFILTAEYDLFNPQATLFLGMSTEMNEYFALEQSRKSILARISKAKRGIPTTGALPYGRKFNKKKQEWTIITEKKDQIQWAAEKYLSGSTMLSLAEILGMNVSTLHKTLKYKCGDTWECRFRNKRVGIDETVHMQLPRLLPQETIDAIHQRCEANKTYTHGQTKYRYLLGRVVFCAHCGRTLSGLTDKRRRGLTYYKHPWVRNSTCTGPKSVRADHLEDAVLIQLLNLATDPAIAEKAHTDTLPNPDKRVELENSLSPLKKKLSAAQTKKKKIIDMIADDFISIEDAKPNIDQLKIQEQAIKKEITETEKLLRTMPDPKTIKRKSKLAQNVLRVVANRIQATENKFLKMEWEDKRKLVQTIFAGQDIDGNRAGVYIRKNAAGVEYELRGDLLNDTICGSIPMPSDQYDELLKIFKPERDLGQDDLIYSQETVNKQEDNASAVDMLGKSRGNCRIP